MHISVYLEYAAATRLVGKKEAATPALEERRGLAGFGFVKRPAVAAIASDDASMDIASTQPAGLAAAGAGLTAVSVLPGMEESGHSLPDILRAPVSSAPIGMPPSGPTFISGTNAGLVYELGELIVDKF
mmetsp:Transcript_46426/g.108356  ORF Transcript_46426/g.108356 Transcript_46426/m.108356 type:complete len:129 (+) Transcript_46426:178-564(+)